MSNLDQMIQFFWDKALVDEAYLNTPFLRLLLETRSRQEVFESGTYYQFTRITATREDQVQEYNDSTPTSGDTKTIAGTAKFYRKRMRIPVLIPESLKLAGTRNDGGTKIIDAAKEIVRNTLESLKLKFNQILWRTASTSRDADPESSLAAVGWQGISDALTFAATQYGGVTRGTTIATNALFQGASVADTWADNATQLYPTIFNLRKMIDVCSRYGLSKSSDFVFICGPTAWRELQSQCDAGVLYQAKGPHAEFGFTTFTVDGVEVFSDPFLTDAIGTAHGITTASRLAALLHLPSWHIKIAPETGMGKMPPLFDLSQIPGQLAADYANVPVAGNIVCAQPNKNFFTTAFYSS